MIKDLEFLQKFNTLLKKIKQDSIFTSFVVVKSPNHDMYSLSIVCVNLLFVKNLWSSVAPIYAYPCNCNPPDPPAPNVYCSYYCKLLAEELVAIIPLLFIIF